MVENNDNCELSLSTTFACYNMHILRVLKDRVKSITRNIESYYTVVYTTCMEGMGGRQCVIGVTPSQDFM